MLQERFFICPKFSELWGQEKSSRFWNLNFSFETSFIFSQNAMIHIFFYSLYKNLLWYKPKKNIFHTSNPHCICQDGDHKCHRGCRRVNKHKRHLPYRTLIEQELFSKNGSNSHNYHNQISC